jgi:hypothetical protein
MFASGYGFVEFQQYNESLNSVAIFGSQSNTIQLEFQAVQYANILNYEYQVRGYLPMLDATMT